MRLAAAYVAWGAITFPFALWPRQAFEALPALLNLVILTFIIQLVEPRRENLVRIERAVIMAALAVGVSAVISGQTVEATGRVTTAGMLDPNDLAALLATVLPLSLAQAVRGQSLWRVASTVVACGLGVIALKTGSRGGLFAIASGLVVFFAAQDLKRSLQFLVVIGLAAPIAWREAPPEIRARLASVISLERDYNVTTEEGRIEIWKRGAQYFLERPLSGVGVSNYPEREGRYWRRLEIKRKWSTAHNTFVQVFVETGMVGGGLMIAMLVAGWKHGVALWRGTRRTSSGEVLHARAPELLAALVAAVTAAMFLSHAYSYVLFTVLALLAWASRLPAHPADPDSTVLTQHTVP